MDGLSDSVLRHLKDVTGGRYQIGEELGRGGMGVVYRAFDFELDRDVAMKVLNIADEERMRREARVLARIEHPGIIPIHDVGILEDGRVYYMMKLVRGARLHGNVDQPLRLFQRICEPVAFAHSQGIVHRDLKPENIMVGQFGEVLVLDWGVARVLDEPEADGPVVGTKHYMAPEQKAGANQDIDPRSDVFALGKILEFLASTPAKPLQSIVRKATAPDRADRYATAMELAEDVGRYLNGQNVLAHPESIFERAGRVLTNNKTLAALILAYLTMRILLFLFPRA